LRAKKKSISALAVKHQHFDNLDWLATVLRYALYEDYLLYRVQRLAHPAPHSVLLEELMNAGHWATVFA